MNCLAFGFSEHWGPCPRTCDHSRPSRPRNRRVPLTTRNQQAAGCSAQFVLAWASHPPYVSHRGLPPFLLAMTRSPAHGTDGTWAEGRQIQSPRASSHPPSRPSLLLGLSRAWSGIAQPSDQRNPHATLRYSATAPVSRLPPSSLLEPHHFGARALDTPTSSASHARTRPWQTEFSLQPACCQDLHVAAC